MFAVLFLSLLTAAVHGALDRSAVDDALNQIVTCTGIPAVMVSLVKLDENDQLIPDFQYNQAYGVADPACQNDQSCRPVDTNDRFCIGSCTKAFTSSILGTLLKTSEFKDTMWDTPLSKILPANQKYFNGGPLSEYVTLRDILSHRMGIARNDMAWIVDLDQPLDQLRSHIYTLKPVEPQYATFRSSYIYNNWMFAQAGAIVEQINGKSWQDSVREYIFDPLEMENATFYSNIDKEDNFALVKLKLSDGKFKSLPWQIADSIRPAEAAGAVCVTPPDMVKYLAHLLRSKSTEQDLVPVEIVQETWKPSNTLYNFYGTYQPEFQIDISPTDYGFGWMSGLFRAFRMITHGGSIYGYLSNLVLLPDEKIGVFVSTTNGNPLISPDYSQVISYFLTDLMLGKSPAYSADYICNNTVNMNSMVQGVVHIGSKFSLKSDIKLDPNNMVCTLSDKFREYEGTFIHPMFGNSTIKYENTSLQYNLGRLGNATLCQWPEATPNPDVFFLKFHGFLSLMFTPEIVAEIQYLPVEFLRDEEKQVDKYDAYWIELAGPPTFAKPKPPSTTAVPISGAQQLMYLSYLLFVSFFIVLINARLI